MRSVGRGDARSGFRRQETRAIVWMQLRRERSAQSDEAMAAQVFVEILATGQKRHRRAAELQSARREMSGGAAAGGIAIFSDVEASNSRRQQQGGEMRRGESGGDGKRGRGRSDRERRQDVTTGL